MRRRYCWAFAVAAAVLWPAVSMAADTIRIGFPTPLSGPGAVYGKPILTPDEGQALGNDYPYGIIADSYDPVLWGSNEPAAHKTYIVNLKKFTHTEYASGWSIAGYQSIDALAAGIKKAGSINSDAVVKALPGMSWPTLVGERTFSVRSHETFAPEYYGEMVKGTSYPFAVIKNPELLAASFPTN